MVGLARENRPLTLGRPAATALIVLSLVLLAVLSVPPASPQSAGIVGRTRTGCTCHNISSDPLVEPTVAGLPNEYEAGRVYHLNLSLDGSSSPIAGFDLAVSGGELIAPEGSLDVRVDPATGEATHTASGGLTTRWLVDWRAPDEGTGGVTVTLVVNAVNGDGVQGPGDGWARTELEVPEGPGGPLDEAPAFWTVVGVVAVLAIAAAAILLTKGPRLELRR